MKKYVERGSLKNQEYVGGRYIFPLHSSLRVSKERDLKIFERSLGKKNIWEVGLREILN